MGNPTMVSAALAAVGATGLGGLYVYDKTHEAQADHPPLLARSQEKHGDGFSSQPAV